MSDRSTYENKYPFYWLDEVTEVTLNPEKTNIKHIKPDELLSIRKHLPGEIKRISACLKTQAFSLYCDDEVKVVAGHYDQAIRVLQKQAQANLMQYPKSGPLRQTGELLLAGLNELSQNVHRRYSSFLPGSPPDDPGIPGSTASLLTKVLCALSADQLGIILRAAFDVKVIIGSSFRKVCKAIAPFLSTSWKTDISWDSIRSNSGRAEQRDKDIAIEALEKMILKIRGSR